MPRRVLVVAVLRIIGLLWLGESLSFLLQLGFAQLLINEPPGGPPSWDVTSFFVTTALPRIVVFLPASVAFLLASKRVAAVLFPEWGDEAVTLSAAGLGSLVMRIVGVLLTAYGLLGVLHAVVQLGIQLPRISEFYPYDWRGNVSYLVFSLGKVAVGAFLYRRGQRFVGNRAFDGGR